MRELVIEPRDLDLQDKVVHINRVTKVVKGGKNFRFSALVVVGDGKGHVGFGMGKAREVPTAITKGIEKAKRNLMRIPLKKTTISHQVLGRFGAATVLLKPASPGTGVIAGGPVRAVLESAGIQDILTKSFGTTNPFNVVKATFNGLLQMRDFEDLVRRRTRRVMKGADDRDDRKENGSAEDSGGAVPEPDRDAPKSTGDPEKPGVAADSPPGEKA